MQTVLNDTMLLTLVTTLVILLFTAAYVIVVLTSNRRIMQEQQAKIDEIKKSELRYKALFDNSLAGMMKFDFLTWIVLDANHAMLEMFSVKSVYDLQRVVMDVSLEKRKQIEESLLRSGLIDGLEIVRPVADGIARRFLFSARREGSETSAYAVVVMMNAEKRIG